ncbi:hypothetical protein GCM10007079_04490 [Nocardiopsis terrae]|uniref:Uncharacterized protein n=1 Tax=Nocardiopsis terrae TaxID=372655 RepID=A0ABR9HN96_9ACTN|nr:hypothetical protein [Nocardiopsis terrae]GHC71776.1 hypothetical protein GCM10007079_04490 [Nocardiopsis terrae]
MWQAFSAVHSALLSGRWKFISAGASVPGVIWKTNRTPSSTSSWPVRVISRVGGTSPTLPWEVPMPNPMPTRPSGPAPRPKAAKYMPRRIMAVPA